MKIVNNKTWCLFALLALVAGCAKVDRIPETQISDPSYWASETDLKTASNYLYTFLEGPTTDDVWSDDAWGAAANSISDGSRIAPSTDGDYTNNYRLIRAANNIIEHVPGVPVTDAIRNRYLAEAYFFRAWAYTDLVKKYGGVPLILKTLVQDSPELTEAQVNRTQVVDAIYNDLDTAAKYLPTPTALGNPNYGRVSKTAAMSLKAHLALFEGTRAKFHNYGEPVKHLTIARDMAKAVMDTKEHSLYPSYFYMFQLEGEGRQNRENILVKQFGMSVANSILSHSFPRALETGTLNGTKSLVDDYLMKDGLPTSKSPMYVTPTQSTEVYTNRDLRLSSTFFKSGDTLNNIYTIPRLQFHRTGYGSRKYFEQADWVAQRGYTDRLLIRYAEILLTYAEASFELQDGISDADLDLSINLLRTRAGVAKLTNGFATMHNLTMRAEIRRERRVELAMEGFRYWDLIRWKTAEIELPKPVLGIFFFQPELGTSVSTQVDPNGFVLLQAQQFRRFDPLKDYLWPLPINELSLNPNLAQNPNWQ